MSENGTNSPVPGAPTPPAGTGGSAEAHESNEIKRRIQEYEKITKLNSLVRVAFPLAVLCIIIVGVLSTWMTISTSYTNKVIKEQTVQAGEELMPFVSKVLKSFVDDVAPQLVQEFQDKLILHGEKASEIMATEITRISNEAMPFVETQAKESILARKGGHKDLLAELYPDLKNDPAKLEAMSVKLNKAFEFWTVKYMTDTLSDYFLALARINETVVKHYRPAPAKDNGKPVVVEADMLELFMELLNASYEYDPSAQPAAPAAAAAPAEAAPAPAPEPAPAAAPEAAPAPAPEAEGAPAPAPAPVQANQ